MQHTIYSTIFGDDLRRTYQTEIANAELDHLVALAGDALDSIHVDAEPPVSELFPREHPNFARDMGVISDGTILSATALDYMERWIEGDEEERHAIDRDLQQKETELRTKIEERQRREWLGDDF